MVPRSTRYLTAYTFYLQQLISTFLEHYNNTACNGNKSEKENLIMLTYDIHQDGQYS